MELATRRPSVRRDKSQHATAMWVAFERVLEQEDEQLNVKRKVTKTPYIKVTPNLTGSDNDRAIVRMAGQTFAAWRTGRVQVQPEKRAVCVCTGLAPAPSFGF
jgi:hypothetical protein